MDTKETKSNELKILLILGDVTVGKTCIVKSYLEKEFIEINLGTIGFDYRLKKLEMEDGKIITFQIWDIAGGERFRTITKNYYKFAHGIILIYDVTNKKSFNNLKHWIESIRKEISKPIPIYLVGNKIDRESERIITKEQGEEFAKNNGLLFFECTPTKIETVNLIFEKLIKNTYDNYLNPPKEIPKAKPKGKNCNIY